MAHGRQSIDRGAVNVGHAVFGFHATGCEGRPDSLSDFVHPVSLPRAFGLLRRPAWKTGWRNYKSAYRALSIAENRATFILRRRFSLGFSKYRWFRTSCNVPSRLICFFSRRNAFSSDSPFLIFISVKVFYSSPSPDRNGVLLKRHYNEPPRFWPERSFCHAVMRMRPQKGVHLHLGVLDVRDRQDEKLQLHQARFLQNNQRPLLERLSAHRSISGCAHRPGARTERNPMPLPLLPGQLPTRNAERHPLPLPPQLPPRNTRFEAACEPRRSVMLPPR